jgi:hypothetical protein
MLSERSQTQSEDSELDGRSSHWPRLSSSNGYFATSPTLQTGMWLNASLTSQEVYFIELDFSNFNKFLNV